MKKNTYVLYAILAALLYAISTPFSKLVLVHLSPVFIAALLYLGAGMGMSMVLLLRKKTVDQSLKPFTKAERPAILGMIVLDIIAPILLMLGLSTSHPENVALLNNFEIVATALLAFFFFKEVISKRLRWAIVFVVIASIILSVEDWKAFSFSLGSIFVLLATIAWGLENNLTRRLSVNDPLKVVIIKGLFSGLGSLTIATLTQGLSFHPFWIGITLLVGFVAYGLSIFFYVTAQRHLGAAKTSTFYAFAPFVSAFLSLIIFLELPKFSFFIALSFMLLGSYFATTSDRSSVQNKSKTSF